MEVSGVQTRDVVESHLMRLQAIDPKKHAEILAKAYGEGQLMRELERELKIRRPEHAYRESDHVLINFDEDSGAALTSPVGREEFVMLSHKEFEGRLPGNLPHVISQLPPTTLFKVQTI